MTRLANKCEAGYADGTTLTVGNSDDGGAGNPFTTVTGAAAPDGTITFESAAAFDGAQGLRFQHSSVTGSLLLRLAGGLTGPTLASRFFIKFDTIPAGPQIFARFLNGTSRRGDLRTNASGTVTWLGITGTFTGTATLSAGVWYRMEAWITPGTTTTDGRFGWSIYLGNSMTLVDSIGSVAANTGTTISNAFEIGRANAETHVVVWDIDDLVLDDGIGETFIGPIPSASFDLAAVGSAEGTGTAGAIVGVTASAAGAAESTGTAALRAGVKAAAVGSASATGTAAMSVGAPTFLLAAVGSAATAATAALRVNPKLAAVGAAAASGTAALRVGVRLAAIGSASATGTVAASVAVILRAIGSAVASGTASMTSAFTSKLNVGDNPVSKLYWRSQQVLRVYFNTERIK